MYFRFSVFKPHHYSDSHAVPNNVYLFGTFQIMRLVRLLKGEWYKSEQGVWRFNRDASLYGEDIILADNSTMNDLEGLVRRVFNLTTATPLLITFKLRQSMVEPEGQTSPPHNIVAKTDVEMLLRVHDWNTEPQLCVIFGAEAVAKYQCICRTPFKIGNRYFLGEGITEEQHMSSINDMVGGQELVCSYQVLKEIFSEDEMVSLYRFSLEIEMLTNLLDLNIGAANITPDHVVRHPIHLNGMAPRSNNANQQERAGHLAHSYEADMYGFTNGGWTMKTSYSRWRWMGGRFCSKCAHQL
ncbi:hypothetical protein DY000_02047462 [Brassica cretica]|uniref:Uncharacterized protein n=1 Tax=Brassica cretica TaxID=69181 RepID=A0ABQ7EYZ3_BRACR|nr:hypothetical protein DY000_02047462 [Brassica cretica]